MQAAQVVIVARHRVDSTGDVLPKSCHVLFDFDRLGDRHKWVACLRKIPEPQHDGEPIVLIEDIFFEPREPTTAAEQCKSIVQSLGNCQSMALLPEVRVIAIR